MFNYVFKHTADLAGTTNEATGEPWTNDERTELAMRLYPEELLCLACGLVSAAPLKLISHPASKDKSSEYSWKPPTSGFVAYDSVVFKILDGWVNDPSCLQRFRSAPSAE